MPSDAARMIEENSPRPKSHWGIGLLKPVASGSASDYGLQRMLWRLFFVWRCQLGGVCLSRKSRGEVPYSFRKAVEKAAKLS